ncbi:MAG: NUDIX domain-containing protein, partial [Calditrichaeota bacterium]
MKYCSACGAPVKIKIPEGDNRPRYVCEQCGKIHYENPRMVVGCIPVWEGKILMCRRAIEPRYGLWTIPAGFMENGETLEQGAMRETEEEACARVEIERLQAVYSLPHVNQVYVIFLARLLDGQFAPGHESLECKLVEPKAIPWDEMA